MIKLEDSIEDLNKETDRLVAERLKELSKHRETVGGRTFFENRKPLYPTINPIRKYPGTCPCGIAASACDYHKDA